jgi:type II secretory pathway predicted ATPase ExeA
MFNKAKELFRDKVDISLYVPLSKKLEIDMMYAISEKEKMILLYGEAGTGKSFLINKAYNTLKEKEIDSDLYFIYNPIEEEDALSELLLLDNPRHRVLFIDEAQTLSLERIETLRMFADNKNYTIILSTHEKKAKEIFAKKHFSTRINYILHTTPLNYDEVVFFISSKLKDNSYENIERVFKKSNYKLIYKFTRGNLREINQLLYRTFDILNYFYTKNPVKIKSDRIDNKYIEMANIFIKEIHA